MTKLWTVREIRWSEEDARYYRVWDEGADTDEATAIIRRWGDLGEKLTCLRCDATEDTGVRCQRIEAVKHSEFMNYDE